MRIEILLIAIPIVVSAAGCSSISMPSLPSVPWFSSAAKSDPTAEALFEEGARNFNEKKFARAIDAFTKIKTDHPFSPLLTQAELKVADAYYLNQQYPEAINAFKEFQSMHPTNEYIPFVIYRLGQSYFDQFTSVERDQKNTEIAKGYFETVVTSHPKSPYAAEARVKLAKSIEYLAEHDFNVASFYLQEEKYPAARDRFENIVRRYQGTPTAAKSLFFLGESYRREKNGVKAALAYEALIQHYPQSKFAAEAKTQLAQLDKEKHDPLAMLLMRDRRPSAAPAPSSGQETASAKLKDVELIAKKEIVFEEPGDEKGIFRRVVDKINPFSSSNDGKKDDAKQKEDEKKPESWRDLMIKKKANEKEESAGILAWLNPFSWRGARDKKPADSPQDGALVNQIDDSLKQKGVDAKNQVASLKAPDAALPEVAGANARQQTPAQTTDPGKLLEAVDSNLKKSGKEVKELPPPEASEALKNAVAAEAMRAKARAEAKPQQTAVSSGLLSSIDQKLKSQGVEPGKFEQPPPTSETQDGAIKSESPKKIELKPKLALEKGPLFLSPAETSEKSPATQEAVSQDKKPAVPDKPQEPSVREVPKTLVKGPIQTQAAPPATKPAEQKKPASSGQEEENKGALDQLRQELDAIGRVLNPFRW